MRKVARALLVVVAVVAGGVPVYSLCQPTGGFCGLQCADFGGGLYCLEKADSESRACWDSGNGHVCGESSEGCDCGGLGVGGF